MTESLRLFAGLWWGVAPVFLTFNHSVATQLRDQSATLLLLIVLAELVAFSRALTVDYRRRAYCGEAIGLLSHNKWHPK